MNRKGTLITLRDKVHQQLVDFVAELDEADRAAEGQADDWAIKNILVHVSLWDERLGLNLQAIAAGQPPMDWSEYLEINNRDFEEHRGDSWEQVEALLSRSQQALLAGLASVDEAQLTQTGLLPGEQDRPAWSRICGTTILHPLLHMTEHIVKKGEAERALAMVLEISAEMEALDSTDEWIGLQRYNQACYYALAGHQPRAIELLSQAFPLNPSLLEWSEKDSDLDSLRAAPEFQALYPQKT